MKNCSEYGPHLCGEFSPTSIIQSSSWVPPLRPIFDQLTPLCSQLSIVRPQAPIWHTSHIYLIEFQMICGWNTEALRRLKSKVRTIRRQLIFFLNLINNEPFLHASLLATLHLHTDNISFTFLARMSFTLDAASWIREAFLVWVHGHGCAL